jgi:WD40 repeat protein
MSILSKLILAVVVAWLSFPVQTGEAQPSDPSRQPMLRIETGMHSAPIYRVAVDRAGRFLVTVSADKTARVWELASGRLMRILRVPIEDGDTGKLYAAAISPDGNTIAVSGWTRFASEKEHCIYLFDRESGRMIRRLGNNGAFTKALVEGVNGAAESFHTGRITYASLVDYLTQRVSDLTADKQHPSLSFIDRTYATPRLYESTRIQR